MKNELTIDVNVHVGPSREDAERAVILLNWYLKDHTDVKPTIYQAHKGDEAPHLEIALGRERGRNEQTEV